MGQHKPPYIQTKPSTFPKIHPAPPVGKCYVTGDKKDTEKRKEKKKLSKKYNIKTNSSSVSFTWRSV